MMTKKDFFIAGLITLFASLLIFINLGSTASPETFWDARTGETVTVTFDAAQEISDVYVNYGISANTPLSGCKLRIDLLNANGSSANRFDLISYEEDIYSWVASTERFYPLIYTVKGIEITIIDGSPRINEIVFLDADGKAVDLSAATIEATTGSPVNHPKAFDEQNKFFPESEKHEMRPEEVSAVRAAYQSVKGWEVQKSTPPLGQFLISAGIRIFGMNPVGWRIIPAFFRLLSVILLFFVGKALFSSSFLAGIFAGLAAFDPISLAVSRLATADAIAVFFVLLAFYFILLFFRALKAKRDKGFLWLPTAVAALVLAVIAFPAQGARGAINLAFTANYWLGLFAALFAALSLLFAKIIKPSAEDDKAKTAKGRKNNIAVPAMLCGTAASFLPMIFISWFSLAYQYSFAIVFLSGFITRAMKELLTISAAKITVGKFEIQRTLAMCVLVLVLFTVYFALAHLGVFGPWIK